MTASLFDATVWCGMLAAVVAALASIVFLRTRDFFYDSLALAVTEIGLVLLAVGIVAGSAAGHAASGLWWTWNARITAALVCFLLYAPYLMLRSAVEEPSRRASSAAIVSVLACFDIPVIVLAVGWWRARHVAVPDGMSPAALWLIVLVGVVGAAFSWMRLRKEQARRAADAARRGSQEIG